MKKNVSTGLIKIRGAGVHNLKNIDLDIPRDKFIVITGVSGSGKSSLAFDTIFAEGQRRYMESLSSYARQFLGQMEKPKVTSIEGMSPAISIDQKSTNRNPRSTVGTVTEIYDYLRLLYARIGIPHCPNCGKEIKKQSIDEIVDTIMKLEVGTKIQLLAYVVRGKKGRHEKVIESAKKAGYSRVRIDGNDYSLDEEITLDKNIKHNIEIIVDRLVIKEGVEKRLSDSIETVFKLSDGLLQVDVIGGKPIAVLNDVIRIDPHLFGVIRHRSRLIVAVILVITAHQQGSPGIIVDIYPGNDPVFQHRGRSVLPDAGSQNQDIIIIVIRYLLRFPYLTGCRQ